MIVRLTQGTQALAMYIGVYVWHVLYHAVNSVIVVQWMHLFKAGIHVNMVDELMTTGRPIVNAMQYAIG